MSGQQAMAFLLVVHGDPELAVRLCARLAPHRVFVHVDAKSVAFPVSRLAELPNVTISPVRRAVYWSSFPMVEAIMDLLKLALADGTNYLRYVVLSGACYPVRPIAELAEYFRQQADAEDIQMVRVTPGSHLSRLTGRKWRMTPLFGDQLLASSETAGRLDAGLRRSQNWLAAIAGRDFPRETGRQTWFGSSWWALTDACARFIVRTVAAEPRLDDAFRSVWCPEEHYFHTIIGNSPFAAKARGPSRDLGPETIYDAPLHVIYPSPTRDFGNSDADFDLVRGSGKFFLRKASSMRNTPMLDRIDSELLHLAPGIGG